MHRDRKLNRLQGYDYSSNALYFVTSCVAGRICCFGEVREGEMFLNNYGEIAEQQLGWLEQQYNYVVLQDFVVMPNHIHGIIEIDNRMVNVGTGRDLSDNANDNRNIVGTGRDLSDNANDNRNAGIGHDLSNDANDDRNIGTGHDLFLPPKIKSLSQLMGAYKTTSSKQIHLAGLPTFKWQRSFHDHIIRNEESYFRISNYILNNPLNWKDDKFYNQ